MNKNELIEILRVIAEKTDNKIDDQVVELVDAAMDCDVLRMLSAVTKLNESLQ